MKIDSPVSWKNLSAYITAIKIKIFVVTYLTEVISLPKIPLFIVILFISIVDMELRSESIMTVSRETSKT